MSQVNIDLRAPGLSKPLKLDGDFTFDDLAVSLSGELESPADFLNGKATNFDADIKTVEANVDINGQFRASEDLVFKANFSADSQNPLMVANRFHLPEDLNIPPLTDVSASGDIIFDGKADFPNLDAKAAGDGFDVSYQGQLDLRDGLSGQGKATAKLLDMSVIDPYLKEPIEALSAINAVDLEGDVSLAKDSYAFSSLTARVTGPDLTTSYTGSAKYEVEDLSAQGSFDTAIGDLPAFLARIGQAQPDAAALKRVTAKGDLALDGKKVTLTNLTANTSEGDANCLLYTSPSPRDQRGSRMPSSA